MAQGQKKKRRGGCGVLTVIAVVIVVGSLLLFEKAKAIENEGSILSFSVKTPDVREYLSEYTDEETRFIYAHYDGIEDDIDAYTDPAEAGMPEEERKESARIRLESEHVRTEMQKALEERVRQVCVIGEHSSLSDGYSNSSAAFYDNGVFRKFPYSTFWLRTYEAVGGYLSVKRFTGKTEIDDRWSVYTFDYYPLSDQEILGMKGSIDRETDDILSCIPQEADLWETCRIIHDELIRRISYDNRFGEHCHDLYGALAEHKAVCEGYALAFDLILKRAGGSGDVVVSDWDEDPDTTTHAWNRIDEHTNEKYIDVTWDDNDYTDPDGDPFIMHDFFGLTEEEIADVDSHHFAGSPGSAVEDSVTFNYYRHEGYMLSEYDEWTVADLFLQQYWDGANLLTVRFDNVLAYQNALSDLTDTDIMNEILGYMGIYGKYWRTNNDDLYIISAGLGELPDTEEV